MRKYKTALFQRIQEHGSLKEAAKAIMNDIQDEWANLELEFLMDLLDDSAPSIARERNSITLYYPTGDKVKIDRTLTETGYAYTYDGQVAEPEYLGSLVALHVNGESVAVFPESFMEV